jgi:hypothetical protein
MDVPWIQDDNIGMSKHGIFKSGVFPELVADGFVTQLEAVSKLMLWQALNPDAETWFVSPQCHHNNAQGMCVDCDDEARHEIDYGYVCSYHEDDPDECCCAPGF